MTASARSDGATPPPHSRLSLPVPAVIAAGALFSAVPPPALAATLQNFQDATTADYLALCSTAPGQDNYVAAVHFCEGFASGAYQYYLSLAARDPAERFVCLPTPVPSRDKIKADFVAWAKANPAVMNDPPVDSLFRYLGQTYPCPASAKK
jgi:hypothetical protein